jgi:hypothetical protein
MARLEMALDTKLPPEGVVRALTDFSDKRPDTWPILSREFYEVYTVGETSADIREGQTKLLKVWAKEHYDWSTPGKVVWAVQEASFVRAGSSISATVTPGKDGGSEIHIVWERFPTSMKGRFFVVLMKMTGGKPMASYWKKVLDGLAEEQQKG